MTRLFVAVWPPSDVVDLLGGLTLPDERGVRWVSSDNWHVTLRFLGDAEVDPVCERLAAVDLVPATAVVGPRIVRLGDRAIAVPVEGLDALASAVVSALIDIGHHERRPFHGHLTLGRTKQRARSGVIGTAFEARFDVTEIALVASDPGSRGSTYRTVASFLVPPSSPPPPPLNGGG